MLNNYYINKFDKLKLYNKHYQHFLDMIEKFVIIVQIIKTFDKHYLKRNSLFRSVAYFV